MASEGRGDVQAFLALLSRLAAGGASCGEEREAAALFDWRAELVVSRAPGRLDVMGGTFSPRFRELRSLTRCRQALRTTRVRSCCSSLSQKLASALLSWDQATASCAWYRSEELASAAASGRCLHLRWWALMASPSPTRLRAPCWRLAGGQPIRWAACTCLLVRRVSRSRSRACGFCSPLLCLREKESPAVPPSRWRP